MVILNLNFANYNDADVNMSGIVTAADITKIILNLVKFNYYFILVFIK